MHKKYGKIVRDGILERVRANRGVPVWETLSREGAINELFKKLNEEAGEFARAETRDARVDEAGDVSEVVRALCRELGVDRTLLAEFRARFSGEQATVGFFEAETACCAVLCSEASFRLSRLGYLESLFEAVCRVLEIAPCEVERARLKKHKQRGGFEGRIYLKGVAEQARAPAEA